MRSKSSAPADALAPLTGRLDQAVAFSAAPGKAPQFAALIVQSIMTYYACEELAP